MDKVMGNNYLSRFGRFVILRLLMSRWLPSKSVRPALLRMIGIKIGKNAHVGANVTFDTLNYRRFYIGDNVTITMNTVLLIHYFTTNSDGSKNWKGGDLVIGNNVFIGANTVIAKPVIIGDNVVIAAGSVVTRDVPSNCLYGGVPGKVLKKFVVD